MMTAEHSKTTPLQAERQARRWSRARLAREAGITEQTIVRAEKCLVETSLGTWVRIAAALDVPVESLVPERAHASNLPDAHSRTPHGTSVNTSAPGARRSSNAPRAK